MRNTLQSWLYRLKPEDWEPGTAEYELHRLCCQRHPSPEVLDDHVMVLLGKHLTMPPLHWTLICTKVFLRLFYDTTLAILKLLEDSKDKDARTSLVGLTALNQFTSQVMNSTLRREFIPKLLNLDSIWAWKVQVQRMASDFERGIDEKAQVLIDAVCSQIKRIVTMRDIVYENWCWSRLMEPFSPFESGISCTPSSPEYFALDRSDRSR